MEYSTNLYSKSKCIHYNNRETKAPVPMWHLVTKLGLEDNLETGHAAFEEHSIFHKCSAFSFSSTITKNQGFPPPGWTPAAIFIMTTRSTGTIDGSLHGRFTSCETKTLPKTRKATLSLGLFWQINTKRVCSELSTTCSSSNNPSAALSPVIRLRSTLIFIQSLYRYDSSVCSRVKAARFRAGTIRGW